MEQETLTDIQIAAWRKIIYMQLETKMPGAGVYAIVMPEEKVIEYWRRIKNQLEVPNTPEKLHAIDTFKKPIKPTCNHSNSFTGNKGTYCIDCEKYV